ncbi:unnamed protein product [Adineta steineri]|uniref:Reverse transcriptase n=1 Tax=Adineta steineri TaxID=433720 RepID=A0A813RM42_9BILA|nr:unnamed protein product [Adineta steineri]CAF1413416.1 unnamed protein product [Adineta steineri]CAF1414006.1 unnamed protein product [Adineta steineri]
MIPLVLLDDARQWYVNNLDAVKDWTTFTREIQNAFSSPVHRSLAIKQIGNRVQGLEETVLHYYHEMMELCDMIDHEMKDELKVGYLLAGIKLSLQKEVMRRNPRNPNEFLNVAQAEEKLDLSINVQTSYDSTLITDSLSAFKPQIKSSLPYKSTNTQKSIRCFNCQKIGHIARNCFLKKLLAGANDGTALVNVHHPSLIIIPTWINNMKINGMVDTGATSSLITTSTVNKLKLQQEIVLQSGEVILGDSRTKIMQYGRIYLRLKIDEVEFGIEAIVVDQLTNELILGVDFLRKFQVEIKVAQQYLVLQNQQQRIYTKFGGLNNVRLTQQYTIFPRCKRVVEAVVDGIIDNKEMYLKVMALKQQQAARIRLCDGLVDINNGYVQVTIYNPTSQSVILQKAMVIGEVDVLKTGECCSVLESTNTMEDFNVDQNPKDNPIPINQIVDSLTHHLLDNNEYYQQIYQLVEQNKVLFDISQHRTIKATIHHVINTGDHAPISAKPYFKTIEQRKNIQHEVDKMLRAGIAIPSTSEWSSPVVLLTKPDGTFRFIIDYRKLNVITKKDVFPQPSIEELVQRLGGHSWFTKIDMKAGYHQIPIQHKDKEKTAFVTQDGLYQFEVLPMGLTNAPASFQRLMHNIIGYNRWDYTCVYLDDVIIFSNSFEQHMNHLQEIFQILKDHNFTLNPNKCSIAQQSIEFLSHTITQDSIVPLKERIQAILNIPQPTTLAQANKFIGKIGWYRKFIPKFSSIAAPIHRVTNKIKSKRKDFFWGTEQIEAADKLKEILTTQPLVLKYPHPTAQFILSTDASDYAIGGTLKQIINGQTHYNYFLSRLLSDTEKRYSTIEREALAIFWCLNKLQQYLGGRDVLIITDHKPLQQFHIKMKINSKRINDWLIKNQEILSQIIEVQYRKGSQHGDADGMSRPDLQDSMETLNAITRSKTKINDQSLLSSNKDILDPPHNNSRSITTSPTFDFSLARISAEQQTDPYLSNIWKQSLENKWDDNRYMVENKVLYKVVQPTSMKTQLKLICIPKSMQLEVIQCYHDHPTGAHFGINRTWFKVRQVCYWPRMKEIINDYIRSCEKCAKYNVRRSKPPGHLNPIEYPQGPLELVSMDFWGPTPQYSTNGNKYVLVITDYYTKYVVATPLPNNTAITTAKCFVEHFIFKFGTPRRLITDQGVHFNNELMKNVTELLGTNHIQATAYHPQSNGLTERFNSTFHTQLAKFQNDDLSDWDEFLGAVTYAYNTGIQSTTKYSPFQLMFGRRPVLPLDHTSAVTHFDRPNDYWRKLMKWMNIYKKTAQQQIQLQQQRTKQRFDAHRTDQQFQINDLVWWKIPGIRGKFQQRFSGPFIIIKSQHPSYTIQDSETTAIKHVHVSDLNGDTFRAFSDYIYDETRKDNLRSVKYGEIIFVKTDMLRRFFTSRFISIREPFVLITHNSDDSAPGRYIRYLRNPKVLHWYASNLNQKNLQKISPIPIGLANIRWVHGTLDKIAFALKNHRKPWSQRTTFLYVNFAVDTNIDQRTKALSQASTIQNVQIMKERIKLESYLEQIGNSKFVLSPPGGGIDCHRTWEALLMGAVPIVLTSGLDPLFTKSRSIIIDDWSKLSYNFLSSFNSSLDDDYVPDVLYADYWRQTLFKHRKKVN